MKIPSHYVGPLLLCLYFALRVCSATTPYWTQIQQKGAIPNPVSDGGAAHADGRFYVFGGLNGSYPVDFPINDFAVFDVATETWIDLSVSSTGMTPEPRAEPMMWVGQTESGVDVVAVAGGRGPFRRGKDLTFSDTHYYNIQTGRWVLVDESNPRANRSCEAAVVSDPQPGSSAYAFSGSSSTMPAFANRVGGFRDDLVRYVPPSGWKKVGINELSPIPPPRGHHCLIYSESTDSLFTYGGYTKDPLLTGTFTDRNYLGDLWEFRFKTRTWVQHAPSDSSAITPGKRDNSKLFYDDQNDRLWLFGGGDWTFATFNDLWYYSFQTSTWTQVIPNHAAGSPATRLGYLFFTESDTQNIYFYIFGGSSDEFGSLMNDMWRLTIPLNY